MAVTVELVDRAHPWMTQTGKPHQVHTKQLRGGIKKTVKNLNLKQVNQGLLDIKNSDKIRTF